MIQVSECIEKLSSADESERIYAAEDIGYANEASGVPALLARLPIEPSRAVAEAIVASLAQIDSDCVVSGVIEWLDSDDAFVRNQAVEILRKRGGPAITYLERAFRQGRADRRKFVIDVLARLPETSACGIYEAALLDSDLNVVIAAVESLGDFRQRSFQSKIESLVQSEAHPMLLCACLEALAQIGDPNSPAVVRARLGGASQLPGYLLASYMKLLGVAGEPTDVAEIADTIGRDGFEAPALNALTSLRNRYPGLKLPQRVTAPLIAIIRRGEPTFLGYQAVRLLAALMDDNSVFQFVESCLENAEKTIRMGAIQSMREAGGERGNAVIRRAMAAETDSEVLQAAGIRGGA